MVSPAAQAVALAVAEAFSRVAAATSSSAAQVLMLAPLLYYSCVATSASSTALATDQLPV